MDERQKQLIQEQMKKIPKEVRAAIESSDWERTVFNLGRAHKLHIDDIDALSVETILVMVGLEHPRDFIRNLEENTGIKKDTILEIVEEINDRLFSKIRKSLQEYYEKVSAGEIMASEEKDELHHAGVEVEDDYSPQSPKKPIKTVIDQRAPISSLPPESLKSTPSQEVGAPPATSSQEEDTFVVPQVEKTESEGQIKIPEIRFDPYREPIE